MSRPDTPRTHLEERTPVVEMRSIRKTFLDVVANSDVDFTLYKGEICALLGENGAGKTTLMNILFGYYAADSGEIRIGGEKVSLSSPRDAITRRIGMVHQHFTLVPSQTVLENTVVGSCGGFFLDMGKARRKLLELQRRFGLHVDPDAPVWTLPIGGQQKVEILKALYRDARILILDEPTAVLAPLETMELFGTLRALAAEGCSVVFISHKLYEVMEIADRVVVLSKGSVAAERETRDTDERELANLMVGRELAVQRHTGSQRRGDPALEIRSLSVKNDKELEAVKELSLAIRSGEILGMAGVSGNGQRELAEALFGLRVPDGGDVLLGGEPLPPGRPKTAVDRKMARIPEDRMTTGLLLELTVEENLVLENHASFRSFGMLDHAAIGRHADRLIGEFGITTDGRRAVARTLSGGNLQKIILARELSASPRAVVAAQPTRGLDVGAIEYVHKRILEARESGAAILLISEDLDEIFLLADRIAVMYEGRIMGVAERDEASREQVGLWMSGVNEPCA